MINLATVGTSAITDKFLSACKYSGRFNHYAVYSRSIKNAVDFAKKHDVKKTYTDIYEMARDSEIDAVYIASPNVFHVNQSKNFLENGKHVICEKPIVTNSNEYIELKKLADSKSLIYMEAIISYYSNGRDILKNSLNKIGNVALARLDFSKRSTRYDKFLNGENPNAFNMSLKSGTLMDLGVYAVYAAVDLFGMPNEISAVASYLLNGADGSGAALFKYDKFSAVLSYSKTGQSYLNSEIIGDSGTIKIESISQYAGINIIKNNKEENLFNFPEHSIAMRGEAIQFADYIENFENFADKYNKSCSICLNVHKCMDIIKTKAGIVYR